MKKYLKKILALTLILSLCTTTVLSGTLAKYVSEVSATGALTAAQFNLDVTDGANSYDTANNVIDLGDTSYTGYTSDDDVINLYPGQSGSFTLETSFISDVDSTITATVVAELFDSAALTAISGVPTDTTYSTYIALLDATGLRFNIADTTTDTDDIPSAYSSTDYTIKASGLEDALAKALADTFTTATTAEGTSSVTVSNGVASYTYDAKTESATAAKGGELTISWEWPYKMTAAASGDTLEDAVTEATLAESDQLYTEDSGLITGGNGGTTYYIYEGLNYASSPALTGMDYEYYYDVIDTTWGNEVYDYMVTKSGESTIAFIIDVTINATQDEVAAD